MPQQVCYYAVSTIEQTFGGRLLLPGDRLPLQGPVPESFVERARKHCSAGFAIVTVPLPSGKLTVSQEWSDRRHMRASWLVARRRHANRLGVDMHRFNDTYRREAPQAPAKPTVDALRAWARDANRRVEDGIPRGLPCGADDAYGEKLDGLADTCKRIWTEVGRF